MELVRKIFDDKSLLYVIGAIVFSGLCAYYLPLAAIPLLLALAVALFALEPKVLVACYMVFIPIHLAVLNVFEVSGASLGTYSVLGGLKDLLFLAILLSTFVFARLGGRLNRIETPVLVLFLIFVMLMIFHIPGQGLKIGLMGFKASAEFVFTFLLGASLGAKRLKPAVWALVISGLFATIYGFFQVASQGFSYVLGVKTLTLAGRASGVFGNLYASNAYGVYLVVVTLSAFYLFEDARGAKKVFALLVAILAAIALVLTFSRRSWLALMVGMLAYSYFTKSKTAAIPLIAALVAGILIAPTFFIDRLRFLFSLADSSTIGRFIEWRAILKEVFSQMFVAIWGLGLGAYGTVPIALKIPGAINSHNYYLLILGQLGIVGLAMFLALVGYSVARGIKACRAPSIEVAKQQLEAVTPTCSGDVALPERLCACLLGVVFALLVASFFGIVIETFPANFLFWLFLGAVANRPER